MYNYWTFVQNPISNQSFSSQFCSTIEEDFDEMCHSRMFIEHHIRDQSFSLQFYFDILVKLKNHTVLVTWYKVT
jgi:hypothetical protein